MEQTRSYLISTKLRHLSTNDLVVLAREIVDRKYQRRIDDGKVEVLGIFEVIAPFICLRIININRVPGEKRTISYIGLQDRFTAGTLGKRVFVFRKGERPAWEFWRPQEAAHAERFTEGVAKRVRRYASKVTIINGVSNEPDQKETVS